MAHSRRPQILQEFRGGVSIWGNHNQVGVFNSDEDAAAKSWMARHASSSQTPEFHGDSTSGNVINRIFQSENFQACLSNTARTLVLEGRLGVGKTTTMLGLLRRLDLQREYDQEQQQQDETLVENNTPSGYPLGIYWKILLSFLQVSLLSMLSLFLKSKQQNSHKRWKGDSQRQAWQDVVVASVFLDSGNTANHLPEGILTLLLEQFVEKIPGSMVHVRTLIQQNQNSKPSAEAIANTIIMILRKTPRACIFVDALDECNSLHITQILRQIARVQRQSNAGVVMSQRGGTVKWQAHFDDQRIGTLNTVPDKDDITRYLEKQLSSSLLEDSEQYAWIQQEKVCDKVKNAIINASGNIFLLVVLNLKFVLGARCEGELDEDLKALVDMRYNDDSDTDQYCKRVLHEAFERNINRILSADETSTDRRNAKDARLTLAFMREAFRPLSIKELPELLAIRIGQRKKDSPRWATIVRYCQGLVEEDTMGNARYIHVSLGEYLKSDEAKVMIPDMNELLGKRCMTYVNLRNFCQEGICPDKASLGTRLEKWPFMNYAATNWSSHLARFEQSQGREIDERDYRLGSFHYSALEFLKDDCRVESVYQITRVPWWLIQALLRSNWGKAEVRMLKRMEESGELFRIFSPNETTGLHLSCGSGSYSLFHLLVEPSQSLDCQNSEGLSPLHLAVMGGNVLIVKTLIQRGVQIDLKSASGITPLMLAADDTEIFNVIMKKRDLIDINAQTHPSGNEAIETEYEGYRQSVLHFVVKNGNLANLQILLSDAEIDGNIQDSRSMTPLHTAAERGHLDCLKALLSHGVDINLQDSRGMTALHTAAKRGQLDCIKALFDFGVDPYQKVGCLPDGRPSSTNYTGDWSYQGTILHLACMLRLKRASAVVGHLLKIHNDLCHEINGRGMTPLHMAIWYGGAEIVHLILKKATGVDVNIKDNNGWTPLHWAATAPQKSSLIIPLLLEQKDIDINLRDNNGYSALHICTELGIPNKVAFFLKQKAVRINSVNKKGASAYFYVTRSTMN